MQKDLFGTAPAAILTEAEPKSDFFQRLKITLRFDQALVVLIGLLVAYVLIFSFGVETGKRYSMAEIRAERQKREQMVSELKDKIFQTSASPAPSVPNSAPPSVQRQQAAKMITAASAQTTVVTTAQTTPPNAAKAAMPIQVAPVPTSGKPEGKFTVQIATVTSKAVADKEIKRLLAKGHPSFVIPKGKLLQICIGGFESREQANTRMKQLKTAGLAPKDAYVRAVV